MRPRWFYWFLLINLGLLLLPAAPVAARKAQDATPPVITLRFEGVLQPVMMDHLKRAQQIAAQDGAQAIILELDTPGGGIDLMTQIVEEIRASQIPVIVYVSPKGAMAGSAGTIITLAGHLSAMAPETAIGSASPVGPNGGDIGQTEQAKIKEMLKATARSLAGNRPPQAVQLYEDMIDNARAVSVSEAVKAGLVDFQATDTQDLLRQLDGRQVAVAGKTVTLYTAQAALVNVPMSLMEQILAVIANPNIAFLLLAVGIQAILIEVSHPGGWVAGFFGAVCLLLAAYGMGFLPVNWFGLLFMALAFVLFILDIKTPTHGALTIAGVASFIAGALVLFNSPNVPSFQRVSVPLVVATGIALGAFFLAIVGYALRAQRTPVKMDRNLMIGKTGIVNTPLNPEGTVLIGSELWSAVSESNHLPVAKGTRVEVIGLEHLRVRVKPEDQ
jgi:membrane-bound serine protease (ClpP class)